MDDCLFCKIAAGELDAEILYQDDRVVAFEDIEPQAPRHTLIIPRQHIATINDITEDHSSLVGHMVNVARQIAQDNDLADDGYRLVFNCNKGGGQVIFHIHLHLLGGRPMTWPPG